MSHQFRDLIVKYFEVPDVKEYIYHTGPDSRVHFVAVDEGYLAIPFDDRGIGYYLYGAAQRVNGLEMGLKDAKDMIEAFDDFGNNHREWYTYADPTIAKPSIKIDAIKGLRRAAQGVAEFFHPGSRELITLKEDLRREKLRTNDKDNEISRLYERIDKMPYMPVGTFEIEVWQWCTFFKMDYSHTVYGKVSGQQVHVTITAMYVPGKEEAQRISIVTDEGMKLTVSPFCYGNMPSHKTVQNHPGATKLI